MVCSVQCAVAETAPTRHAPWNFLRASRAMALFAQALSANAEPKKMTGDDDSTPRRRRLDYSTTRLLDSLVMYLYDLLVRPQHSATIRSTMH
jgi:hypothetical protein